MAAPQKHVVAYTIPHWGHARPLVHLCARLVKLRSINLTLLTSTAFHPRIVTELSRSFDLGEEAYAKRIRVISINEVAFMRTEEGDKAFEEAWKTIYQEQELVCTQTGTRYPPLPQPQAIILDSTAVDPYNSVRSVSGNSVKIYTWHPGLTYVLFRLFGPEKLGGKGNIRIKAEEIARQTGRSFKDVVTELVFTPEVGKVVCIPGMLPMYEHEYFPQDFGSEFAEEVATNVFSRIYETLETTDGAILFTPESYEPEAVAAFRRWFAETGRPAYASGPLLPSASKEAANETEKKLSKESPEIQDFLDVTLKTDGKKSLLYISFGSVFWPAKTPEKLWAFLDVVMELNIPFILSHASPFAIITDEVREKVKAYGKGILSAWTPQQLILDHPATGWFVAHGGHNGVTEAISAGVPQILWPFATDQPLNAVHIAHQLQIGYELIEVRTGHGLKPIYRNGRKPVGTLDAVKAEAREVLGKAFGEDGAKKREKLQAVREAMNKEWDDGGSARKDILAFLDSL
ncbi:UDP-Glycosyltransferase/glycogen phosphorylase [Lentinus tigrinus ALCF2SS1-6]|uniref:UDP-Glycosyltransferase/glycogen phosphorylase n=1 Tax=Lentinus tigrinus ALCF2SS1-6 TaxID=1328759 RepID=A0A5C2SKK3_9APHY|nr:UDP-Glycosyltransferase/glycogen phosphorylase [Lentinus tigrinus ALCF2SS1-6]